MTNSAFTIKQLGEKYGVPYGQASGFIGFCIHLGLVEDCGEAPKPPGHKGKAANLFRFTDAELGSRLKQLLTDTAKAELHQEA